MEGSEYAPQKSVRPVKRSSLFQRIKKHHRLYIMLLPMLVLVVVFSYVPLSGWGMAFTEYKLGAGYFEGAFTGLKQFKLFFAGANDAGYVLRNTLVINFASLFINLVVACAFAILLNELRSNRLKKFAQAFSFFPYFISWVIAYTVFLAFFSMESGVVNNLLKDLGLIDRGINFLADPKYSWGIIIFASLWKSIGYNSVIFLAAIAGIDTEQYEAADIDGASRMQKIIHITLPGLAATLVMLLIINSGWVFNSNFEQFYLFRNGGNWERMEVLDVYIYRYGLSLMDYSYATAVGIIKTLASILMFVTVNGIAKKIRGSSLL